MVLLCLTKADPCPKYCEGQTIVFGDVSLDRDIHTNRNTRYIQIHTHMLEPQAILTYAEPVCFLGLQICLFNCKGQWVSERR